MLRKLATFQRTTPRESFGSWVIEFQVAEAYEHGLGWRMISFGVFKVVERAGEGERWFRPSYINGFRRCYWIWFPISKA